MLYTFHFAPEQGIINLSTKLCWTNHSYNYFSISVAAILEELRFVLTVTKYSKYACNIHNTVPDYANKVSITCVCFYCLQ